MTAESRALYILRLQYALYLEEASGLHEFRPERYGDQWGQVKAREQHIVASLRLACTDLAWIISGRQPMDLAYLTTSP